jgi:hypothetical protein
MIEYMTIRRLSPKTQQGYIRTIKSLATFLGAQSCRIGNTQRRLVLEPRRGIEEARHLLCTEHDRSTWMNAVCSTRRTTSTSYRHFIESGRNLAARGILADWAPCRAMGAGSQSVSRAAALARPAHIKEAVTSALYRVSSQA